MLVNEFPPLKVGGGERQAEQLSIQLVRQGLIVGVITRGAQNLPDYEERDGLWVQRIQPRGSGKLESLNFLFGAMWQLWQRRNDYHIIHAHLAFTPAIAAALIGKVLRKPAIVKFGNSGQFGDVQVSQATRRGRVKLALLRRWGKRFITLDQAMHAELLQAGFDPLYGARPLRRAIQDHVQNALANFLISGRIGRRDVVYLEPSGKIRIEKAPVL